MNESQATTKLLRELKKHGYFWKASDRYLAGVPDIVGCHKGRFMSIEMKVDYNSPSAIQVFTMLSIAKHGGYVGVATYSNRSKKWWIMGEGYKLSEAVKHMLGVSVEGGNDIEDKTI